MVYLLDTCVVSDMVKGDEQTIMALKSKAPFQIKISAITAYELKYGLAKNRQIKKVTKAAVLGFLSDVDIIDYNLEAADQSAMIRSSLESKGTPIGAYDVLIAATALANNFILVTSNTKEFERIAELSLENWRN